MVLSWNCQGLGNLSTVRALKDILRAEDPSIVFLMETRLLSKQMERLKFRLGFDCGLFVDRVGLGGGLALLWKRCINVSLKSFSKHHIDVVVEGMGEQPSWRLTGFYGEPNTSQRHVTWNLLRQLGSQYSLPWVCIGDFNEILRSDEKEGGAVRPSAQLLAFKDALAVCNLFDLGWVGPKLTWTNGHKDSSWTRLRLDRAVANPAWKVLFAEARCFTLLSTASDHLPIFVDWHSPRKSCVQNSGRPKQLAFRYEQAWSKEQDCRRIVAKVWIKKGLVGDERRSAVEEVLAKIAKTRAEVGRWGKERFRCRSSLIKIKERELLDVVSAAVTEEKHKIAMDLKEDIKRLKHEEEAFWAQRSRVQWLQLGDSNTRYFHQVTAQRRRNNRVASLVDEDGMRATDMSAMGGIVNSFYTALFKSSGCDGLDDIFIGWSKKISARKVSDLERTFSSKEVETALSQMAPFKAPGQDGLPPGFYQSFWPEVGEDVTQCVLGFLNLRKPIMELNKTIICLIPKTRGAERMKDSRPISLCNTIYKVAAKVLANRLKRVLIDLVAPNQSAFVPGRLITDNIIAAFEVLHSLRHKYWGKEGWYALKLDMSKAYDRVEWQSLRVLLERMGFPDRFVWLIMECVSSVSYSVVLNGEVLPSFKPERGLRQGDPLSPYLFVLVTEVFSFLIHNACMDGGLAGVSVAKHAPNVTHLFFADDSLLFGRANATEVRTLRTIVDRYGAASGQRINFDKSNVVFSCNTQDEDRRMFCDALGVLEVPDLGRYLGLPTHVGRSRAAAFQKLKDNLWQVLHCWSNQFLSQAGKEMLIKAVAQSVPVFYMSCFKIPASIIDELNRMISRFWWGKVGGQRGIHWTSWMNLCTSKLQGGLGFRDFESFNDALLAKQCWRLLHHPESMVGQLLRAKYFYGSSFLFADLGRTPSFIWRSLWHARELLQLGLRWKVGTGEMIRIDDKWLPKPSSFKLSMAQCALDNNMKVAELIDWTNRRWRLELLNGNFSSEDVEIIKGIPICLFPNPDRLVWHYASNGLFNVRSAYHVALERKRTRLCIGESSNSSESAGIWKTIWNLNIMPKVKHFLWKACHNLLPVRLNLCKRGVSREVECPVCNDGVEDILHALVFCPAAKVAWFASPLGLRSERTSGGEFMSWFCQIVRNLNKDQVALVAMIAWGIWRVRNGNVHGDLALTPQNGVVMSMGLLAEFRAARDNLYPNGGVVGQVSSHSWSCPPEGMWKLNCDASIKNNGYVGVGFIFRNWRGEVVAAGVDRFMGNVEVSCAEAMAVRAGLLFAQSQVCRKLIVETDCKRIVDLLNSEQFEDASYLSSILEDCVQLRRGLDDVLFVFVPRICNRVAHALAGLVQSLEVSVPRAWLGYVPPSVSPLVVADCLME